MKLIDGEGSPETGACWMSAIAWYAGEQEWTDAPSCVCPVLRGLAISVNDRLASNENRERVIAPVMFEVVGTADPEQTARRVRFVVRWAKQSARKSRVQSARGAARAAAESAGKAETDAWRYSQAPTYLGRAMYASHLAFDAARAAYLANDAGDAYVAEHVVLPAILRLASWGQRSEVAQVRKLEELPQ